MMKYNCSCCKYHTDIKANIYKHYKTKKHMKNEKIIEKNKSSSCIYCGKRYLYMTSLYRHQKSCNKNMDDTIARLEDRIDKQQIQIDNIGVINITNNITNNIKINSYNETDYSHLSDDDFIYALTKGMMYGNEIIKQVHFNESVPENHNVKLTNLKGKFMKIMMNDKWTVVDKRTQLETLLDTADDVLNEWLEKADRQYKDRHKIIINRSENQKEHILNTFKLMLYNLCV